MHFNKLLYGASVVFMCLIAVPVAARVDTEIQDHYEDLYEEHAFLVRMHLPLYEEGGTPVIRTRMSGFLYPEDMQETIVFPKGTKVIVEDVDFDVKEIIVTVRTDEGKRAEIVFEFPERLDESFPEDRVFKKRFDELFLSETLKNTTRYTDSIREHIDKGDIHLGMTSDDVLLTLGQPFDIVRHVSSQKTIEKWIYNIEGRSYTFRFEEQILAGWKEETGE